MATLAALFLISCLSFFSGQPDLEHTFIFFPAYEHFSVSGAMVPDLLLGAAPLHFFAFFVIDLGILYSSVLQGHNIFLLGIIWALLLQICWGSHNLFSLPCLRVFWILLWQYCFVSGSVHISAYASSIYNM